MDVLDGDVADFFWMQMNFLFFFRKSVTARANGERDR